MYLPEADRKLLWVGGQEPVVTSGDFCGSTRAKATRATTLLQVDRALPIGGGLRLTDLDDNRQRLTPREKGEVRDSCNSMPHNAQVRARADNSFATVRDFDDQWQTQCRDGLRAGSFNVNQGP